MWPEGAQDIHKVISFLISHRLKPVVVGGDVRAFCPVVTLHSRRQMMSDLTTHLTHADEIPSFFSLRVTPVVAPLDGSCLYVCRLFFNRFFFLFVFGFVLIDDQKTLDSWNALQEFNDCSSEKFGFQRTLLRALHQAQRSKIARSI